MKKVAKWVYDPDYRWLLGIAAICVPIMAHPGYASDVLGKIRFEDSWEAGVRIVKSFSSSQWLEPLICLVAILTVSILLYAMRQKNFRVSN